VLREKGLRRGGALPGDPHHGQHRLRLPGHPVQDQGRQLLHQLRLRHQRPLHRQRHGADPDGQAGHGVRRRRRGGALDPLLLFDAMGALSTKYNDTPEKPPAPMTSDPRRLRHRRRRRHAGAGGTGARPARGAKIYAELVGYGATSDGYDMVAPSGEGAVRCMRRPWPPSTPAHRLHQHPRHQHAGGRRPELKAIREVFGDQPPRP
jgi:hypothetical protein